MHHNSSKSHKESDPLDGETEDSPSAIILTDGDLRIAIEDNPKSHISSKQSKKAKSEVLQVEEFIEKIKELTRKSRVKGDLHNYFTCHGCNGFMERKYLLVCSMKDCQRYFCFRCANKKFHSSPQEIADLIHENDWMCYSCSNMCNCRICKKIYLDKEDSFPHQLTKFERAKKRTNSKNDDKDDISEKSEDKSNDSKVSEPKPEPKRGGKAKTENKAQPSKLEDKKANKKQDEKENKQENSKENKKDKIREVAKDKSSSVIQKEVEDVAKEIKKMINFKDSNKLTSKIEKKVPTKKITSQIVSMGQSNQLTSKLKKRGSKPKESDESSNSDPEYEVEATKKEKVVEEDKKVSGKESNLSRNNSSKEPVKPAKSETNKVEKAKEESQIVMDKKFTKPKIKRELKQLLKMNDEMNDFNKFISEESFEMSNSMPLAEENSRASNMEPKKVVRRFRAKPDEVCHLCKNIYEKEHMYPCTVPGCDKSFCSFCIQNTFIKLNHKDFDTRVFKADQFICYVCGKFCKCKECDKSSYHANKRRARRNEMRMGSSRRGRRIRGRRVIEPRRRKFYDTLPEDYMPGNPYENSNTIDRSFNYDDDKNDYSYDRDLEDELDDDEDNDSDISELPELETKKILMRKRRLRAGAGPTKIVKAAEPGGNAEN